jgi:hypothetical protein
MTIEDHFRQFYQENGEKLSLLLAEGKEQFYMTKRAEYLKESVPEAKSATSYFLLNINRKYFDRYT